VIRGITLKAAMVMLLAMIFLAPAAVAGQSSAALPAGFYLIAADLGTALYQRDALDGNHDFIQVVALREGAAVRLLHGPIVEPGQGAGVYAGDNPLFATQSLAEVWHGFSAQESQAFCLTNGQFFSAYTGPVTLSFPLKVDNRLISDGHAIDQYRRHQLMLAIWPDRADIVPLTAANLQTSSAPDIVAGLSEAVGGRRSNSRAGRTFVGVGQPDGRGNYGTIFFFTSRLARTIEATAALRAFGAVKVMMLDGGASAQLICQGQTYAGPGRRIPQTIAVLAAPPPDWPEVLLPDNSELSCVGEAAWSAADGDQLWPTDPWC
jgi:hypothetical protein